MKYTMLGFSQQIAADYELDLNDLAILRWFVDFKESGNMRSMEIDGNVYYWVFYEKNIRRIIYNKIAKKRNLQTSKKDVRLRYIKEKNCQLWRKLLLFRIGRKLSRTYKITKIHKN